jgi:multiple sugar transport system permease protein
MSTSLEDDSQGMSYLDTVRSRWVTVYIPLAIFVFVLLFPFYWMVITSVKPNNELLLATATRFG